MIIKKDVGDAIILGHKSHMLCYERGGICSIAGLMPRVLQNQPDGTLDLETLALNIPNI